MRSDYAFPRGKYTGYTDSDIGRGIRLGAVNITSVGVRYKMSTRGLNQSPQQRSPPSLVPGRRAIFLPPTSQKSSGSQCRLLFVLLTNMSTLRGHLRSSFINERRRHRGCFLGSLPVMTLDILKGANTVSSTVPVDFFLFLKMLTLNSKDLYTTESQVLFRNPRRLISERPQLSFY